MPPRVSADPAAAVLDAAAGCYLTLGVTKTTASDIARAAGMSRATLYRRFGSHEAIFMAVLERSPPPWRRRRRHTWPGSPTRPSG